MNWGNKIMTVYILFVAGIMLLVFKSSSQKVELVTTNYYAKELKYQDRIDEQTRVDELSDTIVYKVDGERLRILFPKDFAGKPLKGEAVLYAPANEANDVTHPFYIKDSIVEIPIAAVKKGFYHLQLSWQADALSYYYETKIDIKK